MAEISVVVSKIDSKAEMIEKLMNTSTSNVVIGKNSEQEINFYIMGFFNSESSGCVLSIGIISEGHGLKPSYLINEELKLVYIGFNREVDVINYDRGTLDKRIKFDSLFYEMKCVKESSRIIIICELGISCVSYYGEMLWNYISDIVIDYKLLSKEIELVTDDETILLSLDDGTELLR